MDKVDYVGDHQDEFARHAGPGYWNDPDMVKIIINGSSRNSNSNNRNRKNNANTTATVTEQQQ